VCLHAAELLESRGIGCTVVDPRWVKPVDPALPGLAAEHRLVAVVEDNSRAAGVGAAVALALGDAEVDVPVRRFGIPEQFLAHAKRAEVLADIGLTPVEIAGRISASMAVRNADGRSGRRAVAEAARTSGGRAAAKRARRAPGDGRRAARAGEAASVGAAEAPGRRIDRQDEADGERGTGEQGAADRPAAKTRVSKEKPE
jgi:1-deoxy-D-xylulose-5-phosphate synthase